MRNCLPRFAAFTNNLATFSNYKVLRKYFSYSLQLQSFINFLDNQIRTGGVPALTKFGGGLNLVHDADDDAVSLYGWNLHRATAALAK